MNKEITKKNERDIIYLAACALHGQAPESEKVAAMDLTALYEIGKFHSLTAIAAMALESGDAFRKVSPDLAKKWREGKEKAVRKNILLDAERKEILQYMEHEGIWYMPLKGSVLKEFYPRYGMRQMADNDILYDGAHQRQIFRFMTERGYRAESVGKSNHDVYEKPPVYNFEFHTALFGRNHPSIWQAYYEKVKDRLVRDKENLFGYHFRDEDFYVYVTLHACKHYEGAGTGLRSLIDTYVYIQRKREALDWNYVEQELEKLGIADFERQCRTLAEKLFSDPVHFDEIRLTKEESAMLASFLNSGTYGTLKNRVENRMKEMGQEGKLYSVRIKLHYLWKRLIPDMEWFENFEPFYARHRWLIPFFLLYRMLRGVFFRRKKIKRELHIIRNAGKTEDDFG